MSVIEKSFFYHKIFREGEQRGRREQMLSNIKMGLEIKFGTERLQLMLEISQIADLERLNTIVLDIITVERTFLTH